jgi:hypothetical protein
MKVIQKRVVRIKFDIYIFITNGVAILALSKWRLHDFHSPMVNAYMVETIV